MGILGAAGQLFNTARKTPIAGKFLQKVFKGGASKADDVLRGTPLVNNPVVRVGTPPVTSLSPVRSAASKGRVPKGFTQGATPAPAGTTVGRAVYPGQPNPITGGAPTRLSGKGGGFNSVMNFVAPGQNLGGRALGLGGRALNAVGLYEGGKQLLQGDVGGAAQVLAGSFPGRTLGLASKVLGGTGLAGIAKPLIGATALLALTPGSGGNSTMDDYYKTLTPEQKEKFQNNIRSEQENMSDAQKRKMGITPADPLVTRLPDSSPFVPAPTNLPSSPEAVVANPLQQKMAEYEQGRAKATTQEEMDAVRDLGMSIHQAANPQMYEESYNPLMAATFPERYTKTPEDFILQGGIQAPRGMSDKDARQATAFGNKIQTMQSAEVEPTRLQKALAAVKRYKS
jgi:hypothetical protein